MNILLIEDEPKIVAFIRQCLEEAGMSVTCAYDGPTGLAAALSQPYNLILLDVMLPHLNGREVVRTLRQKGVGTPVLMLSALGGVEDRVQGLDEGADDYLVKPFHTKELLARMGALTRRGGNSSGLPPQNEVLTFCDVQVDVSGKTVRRDGREIRLTAKEFALLELFIRNTGRVLSRRQIGERVWGEDFDPNSNVIDVYVNYLRNKLEKGFEGKILQTVVGSGYVMKQ